MELYNTSNELKINSSGVYRGTAKLKIHLKNLDAKYWTINASYSNNNSMYIDAYINISEVSEELRMVSDFVAEKSCFARSCRTLRK